MTSSRARSKGKHLNKSRTTHITEIHASTKAYPAWWSELEESRVLRRRKSMGETVLERNVCFIDTPGTTPTWNEDHVVKYVESLLHKNAEIMSLSEPELMNALSGSGGVQVDLVIYVVPHGERCLMLIKIGRMLIQRQNGHMMSTSPILAGYQV
jgi:hypothetical protein